MKNREVVIFVILGIFGSFFLVVLVCFILFRCLFWVKSKGLDFGYSDRELRIINLWIFGVERD